MTYTASSGRHASRRPVGDWALLLAAAFAAGVLNAVAGGGSFLTLAALIAVGVPPVAANASGTLAQLPGYMASAWAFRRDIRPLPRFSIASALIVAAVAGAGGAAALLLTPAAVFRSLIPWLILGATAAFAFGPRLVAAAGGRAAPALISAVLLGLVCLYGGYFNGGLGIILLASFALLGETDLNAMNGLKSLLSAVLTLVAVAIYCAGGAIFWTEALVMMVAAIVGGYTGAHLARRLPPAGLRAAVVAIGLGLAAAFFVSG